MTDRPAASNSGLSLVPFGGYGPRATPLSGDYPIATLVIGLGQVGWHAVSLLQDMLNASLLPKDLSHVQYLAIARRPAVIPEGRLGRENCLLLSLEETDWAHVPGRYSGAGVARWWPKPPRDRSLAPEYTAIRCYGRLLLFENPQLLNDTVIQRLSNLIQQSLRPGCDGRRLVIIAASISEAEGSGMLFDIAALLRLQLNENPTTIVGVLTADTEPLPEAARLLAMANVYATLKELDAAMVNPGHYQVGLPLTQGTARLPAASTQRPLDYVLITGDTGKPIENIAPAAAVAELAATWLLSYVNGPGPNLAPLPPLSARSERFGGYTTFNVAKLGLPVAAAGDLIGGNLAQQILANMQTMPDAGSVDEWAKSTVSSFKTALMYTNLFDEAKVRDRLLELARKTTAESLSNEFNKQKDKQDFSLRSVAEGIIRRLEQEDRSVEMIDEGHTALRLETLRTRAEDALDSLQRKLANQIAALPTQLSCLQGRGLQWTSAALEQLSRYLNETLNACRDEAANAEQMWADARRRALSIGYEHDERYSGVKRLLRGANSKDVQEIAIAFEYATNAAAERIRWSSAVVTWQRTWEAVDAVREEVRAMLAQVERTSKAIADYTTAARQGMDLAAQNATQFPVGVLVDSEWFRVGVAQAGVNNIPAEQLIQRVFRHWGNNVPQGERRADRFVRDIMSACRQFLLEKFQFEPLQRYIIDRSGSALVKQAISALPKAAIPQWVPARDTTGWTTYEWLRTVPQSISMFPPVSGGLWQRLDVPSPDGDELELIRFTHHIKAEQVAVLKGPYRRAYERIAAEGIPLHIDRRWDATLADLVHNTAQSEVSQLWEAALQAAPRGPAAMRDPLLSLIRSLAVALGVDPTSVQKVPTNGTDFALTVYPLPTFRLRLPPGQCPVVYAFSDRRPRELGQDIYQAVTALGLSEPFLFVVNVNNRRDMEVVVETLRNESYNVVILDEAQFKRVVGSRKPLSMLGEIVLSEVDLTLVSPFYTKAPVPERMFYGREREIKDVRRKIKTHSVALIGGRRIGKTSTLHQMDRLLRVPDSGYIPYYLDCHNAMQYSHFFNNIARRWGIQVNGAPDPTCFEDVVMEVVNRHPGLNVVFLFDEVDRLLTMDMEQQQNELLFRTFRALSNEGKCHFIFSGERWLARAMENSYSALFNFALPVRLAPLDKSVVARLVAEPFEMMNIWLEDAVQLIDRIYEISAGHPNIVQMICQEMVVSVDADKGNVGLLNMKHLERALEQHTLQEDIVHTIWGQMNDLARLITLLWPEEVRHMSLDQIAGKARGAGLLSLQIRDLQEALKDLDLYCFVTPKGREFELVPVAFPALLDYMTVKEMEIKATVEEIMNRQRKEILNR
jgi:Tubulin like/AAA domain